MAQTVQHQLLRHRGHLRRGFLHVALEPLADDADESGGEEGEIIVELIRILLLLLEPGLHHAVANQRDELVEEVIKYFIEGKGL